MWVKVCGIRDRKTARDLAEIGVDAIGLNFYSGSPRVIGVDEAREISKILPSQVVKVGVFVNHSISEVETLATQCRLDFVQLHGDETSAYFAEIQRRLPHVRLIRAWRMSSDGLDGLKIFLDECQSKQLNLAACLVDAHVTGVFGGSGKTVPWKQLASEYRRDEWPPLILAGGLTPDNIAEAILSVHPWGVDVASGVESAPAVKDQILVRQFLLKAKSA
ncbi:MAG: phosphoribosylanthranilate isomerase [Schlesneria sp.]